MGGSTSVGSVASCSAILATCSICRALRGGSVRRWRRFEDSRYNTSNSCSLHREVVLAPRLRCRLCACTIAFLIRTATLLGSAHVHAHAVVLKASLAEHPIRKGTADTVTLHFNSRIEV